MENERNIRILANEHIEQLERIRQSLLPDRKSIAFYCPTKSFRKQFGETSKLLSAAGYSVIHLFGEQIDDEFEKAPNAFQVCGYMTSLMDFIDVFIVPTVIDCLPPKSKKILFYHISFAETELESISQTNEITDDSSTYDELVSRYKHLYAFFPLYDYVVASSPNVKRTFEEIFDFFGRGPTKATSPNPSHAKTLLQGLAGHRLAKQQAIIPAGYPPIDISIRQVKDLNTTEKVITYAPTPLIGKKEWEPYASAKSHGPQIIDALARAFPDYEIVFKPFPNEEKSIVEAIRQSGEKFPNFSIDLSGGSHTELYNRSALMISDFSSTAFTFGFSQLKSVLFFSHNEEALPDKILRSPYCESRELLGGIATDLSDLISQASELLTEKNHKEKIEELRNASIYNPGHSDEYFADNIRYILEDRKHSEWTYYEGGAIDDFAENPDDPEPLKLLAKVLAHPSCKEIEADDFQTLFQSGTELGEYANGLSRCSRLLGWHMLPHLMDFGIKHLKNGVYEQHGSCWYQPELTTDTETLIGCLRKINIPQGICNDLSREWAAAPTKAADWLYLLQWIPEACWASLSDLLAKPLLESHEKLFKTHANNGRASVGFFCPSRAFRSHFGDLPAKLEKEGHAVLYLYGEVAGDQFEKHAGSFCVGGGGIGASKLDFLDVIVTPVIMDCLPDTPRKVLIDHLSYAIFNPNKSHAGHCDMPPCEPNADIEELVKKHTHAASLFRLYDYHVAPSRKVMETLRERSRFFGLPSISQTANPEKIHPDATRLELALKGRRLTDIQCIIPGGYPKLDINIDKSNLLSPPEKQIVFAPTPFKTGENPEGWEKYMCSEYSRDILISLAEALPDYRIVFKPYADEFEEFTQWVMAACENHENIQLSTCGSHYSELYAKSALMVSDLSSTAYTFAFSTCRPVLFYSPKEMELQEYVSQLGADAYVESRQEVGVVVNSPQELALAAKDCLNSMDFWSQKISQFREQELYQVGRCTDYLTNHFDKIIEGGSLPEWDDLRKNVNPIKNNIYNKYPEIMALNEV